MPKVDYIELRDDYYSVAKKYCEVEGGHLPSSSELLTIARVLYDNNSLGSSSWESATMKNKTAIYNMLGIKKSELYFSLWEISDIDYGPASGYARYFMDSSTEEGEVSIENDDTYVICIE